MNMPLRCGRLDRHDEHIWSTPRDPGHPRREWTCNGRVVTGLAEQEWARIADNDEAKADEMRRWWFDGMAEL